MAIFEWRKFNFFDLAKDVDRGNVISALKEATITSATSGNNQIILCDSDGLIHVFTRIWDFISFKGHDSAITLSDFSRQNNLLVTVGDEESGSLFKVWNLNKINKTTGASCLRSVKTSSQKPTALGVSEGAQYMAIGFDRGNIALYKGDISRDRSKTFKNLTSGTSPITGISFKHYNKIAQMFVCSNSGVYVYNLQSRDKEQKIVLDNISAPARCCALQSGHNEGYFMVGRDDAVYCYTSDGRGPCYALEGEKIILQWFRTHLLILTKTVRSLTSQVVITLTVIDIQNKFIVFTSVIDSVAAIIIEFGTCFIVNKDKTILHLDEKDLQSKLNLLFKKNLYDIAVHVAKSNQYDSEGLAQIFKQYGDHLYNKGDYAGSVEQYSKTIGFLEPSYVIRRFLDSRHILYLTDYLQSLHNHGQASADHTTLLLNCFTRLDKTKQLKEFLKLDIDIKKLSYDIDVAIRVCRNSCKQQALDLAKKHGKHDACISILTEDLKLYRDALNYISKLNYANAEEIMMKYGKILMKHCPEETIALVKKICTDFRVSTNSASNINILNPMNVNDMLIDTQLSETKTDRSNTEDFINLFDNSEYLIEFLEHLIKYTSNCSQLVYNTLIEHYLYIWQKDGKIEVRLIDILKNNEHNYDKNHVLILCRNYKFWDGVMVLYEEEKLYHLIVRHYLKHRDYEKLLSCCKRLGPLEPSLWLQALSGLRYNNNAPANLLSQVLQVIAQEKLQSPLQVLNCVAVKNGPKLAAVRDYFVQVFQKENESTRHDENQTEKFRNESIVLRDHIKNLQEGVLEFRGTLCGTCCQPLSLPSLYFLCQHSFHQDCARGYSETEKDCPVCQKKNIQLLDAFRAQSESRGQHETFHNLLDRSSEPFSVVAEYFGRGLFNKIVLVNEDSEQKPSKSSITGKYQNAQKLTNEAIPTASLNNVNEIYQINKNTEGKLRMYEGNSDIKMAIPEGRMRMQEQKQYNKQSYSDTKLYQNAPNILLKNDVGVNLRTSPMNSPRNQSSTRTTIPSQVQAQSKNPFDDEDDEDSIPNNTEYDSSKNPFGEELGDEEGNGKNNQFGKYDNNLNPFAED